MKKVILSLMVLCIFVGAFAQTNKDNPTTLEIYKGGKLVQTSLIKTMNGWNFIESDFGAGNEPCLELAFKNDALDQNRIYKLSELDSVKIDSLVIFTSKSLISGRNGNSAELHWNTRKNVYGYEVKWAFESYVSAGQQAWKEAEAKGLLCGDTVLVGATKDSLMIENLDYSQYYRFAIRALNSADRNDPQNRQWFGYGNSRQWDFYFGLRMSDRYRVPSVLRASNREKTSMTITVNRSIAANTPEQQMAYREYFNFLDADKTILKIDRITVKPSVLNPDATVAEQFISYVIPENAWVGDIATIEITGLSENSNYVINAWDDAIPNKVDACFMALTKQTKGTPGEPIVIKHVPTIHEEYQEVIYDISEWQSMNLDSLMLIYNTTNKYTENQKFYLEGGKAYHFMANQSLCRGVTFQTDPKDVAKGLRAKLYLGGLIKEGNRLVTTNFMLGRQPAVDEDANSVLDIDSICFVDLDIECPLAINREENSDINVGGVGNYFINMYSNGLGMIVNHIGIKNCTFQGFIRGFIREQGQARKVWNEVILENNIFYNCGYYGVGAGGYQWIAGSGNNAASNLYKNMVIRNNTFYDTPWPWMFNETKQAAWTAGPWNITVENNTFVNWGARGGGIFNMRYIPDGSRYTVKNNLFMLLKQDGDARILDMKGADIRNTMTMPDGTAAHCTLDFGNNYSTNDNLTDGQIFKSAPWTSSRNNFQTLVDNGTATLVEGGSLAVGADTMKAEEIFEKPTPPNKAVTRQDQAMHHTNALDKSEEGCVNLYFTENGKNSEIYKNNVGDPRWRNKK